MNSTGADSVVLALLARSKVAAAVDADAAPGSSRVHYQVGVLYEDRGQRSLAIREVIGYK